MLTLLVAGVAKVLAYGLMLLLGIWCWYQWRKWDFLQVARKLPCTVKPLPIIGHAHLLLKGWEGFITYAIKAFPMDAVSTGLHNTCFWAGPIPIVIIHKLEDIQKILNTSGTAEKAQEYEYFKFLLGNGLITAPGHIWKITRRHISPLFHAFNIEQLMPVFNNNSRELVADLAEHVDGEPVNIMGTAKSIALKTVCQLVFGAEVDFDRKSATFEGLIKLMERLTPMFAKRMLNPLMKIDFIFRNVYRKELNETNKLFNEFTASPLKIAQTNHMIKTNGFSPSQEFYNTSSLGSINLIDVFTELQKKNPQFTESDLMCEMRTLYLTGTDTTSEALSSCLLVLGKKLDIQDRVYEEINAVVGPDDDVTMDHISRMQYLDQVYKETLRWSIVVPYILRKTTEDLKLSDCTIPAGNTVGVGLAGLLMDPNLWSNPREFDPERFTPENTAKRPKNSFIPLSGGSRMCIGKTYSDQLVKTMLVHVLRRYRLSTDMDIYNLKKTFSITLVNAEGYNVKFTNRN